MRSTFKLLFYINRQKVKKNGKCPVMGRITLDGKVSQYSTGLEVEPDFWAPDTYRAFFYVGSVVAVRSRLLQKLGEPGAVTEGESTGREIVFSKAEEIRPLMDRLFLAAGGFERGCHTIGHLEEVLFHGTFGTAGIGLQGPAETSREKAEDEQNPWEEYRTHQMMPRCRMMQQSAPITSNT